MRKSCKSIESMPENLDATNVPGSQSSKVSVNYYNSIGLKGKELKKSEKQVQTQAMKVIEFWESCPNALLTKFDIWSNLVRLGKLSAKTPEGSISRCLSDLAKIGKVTKLKELRDGGCGASNHLYKLNKPEPLPAGTQTKLF
jgi:hypothetical protein